MSAQKLNILLFGEFSGVHSNLKEGLDNLGHNTTVLTLGDGFKGFGSTVKLIRDRTGLKAVFGEILNTIILAFMSFKKFDVIQFINPFQTILSIKNPFAFLIVLNFIRNSKRSYYYASGCDSYVFQHMSNGDELELELCRRCLKDYGRKKCFYGSRLDKTWNSFFLDRIDGVISGTKGAYFLAYATHRKFHGQIFFPISNKSDGMKRVPSGEKLRILHGVSRVNFKGSDVTVPFLEKLVEEFPEKFEVTIVERLPFDEYITKLLKADVVIDQLLGDGIGMNSLFSISCGAIPITYYNRNFLPDYPVPPYGLTNIDTLRDELIRIADDISYRRSLLKGLKKYVDTHHEGVFVAASFVNLWLSVEKKLVEIENHN